MRIKEMNIRGRIYKMLVVYELERCNIFEGLIIVKKDDPNLDYFLSFDPYIEGWAYIPRYIIVDNGNGLELVRDVLNDKKRR